MGMAIIAVVFPALLGLGGYLFEGLSLRGSMSAYYHSNVMRDVFVGVLFAIGLFLYLYKGFGKLENYALNLAGIFAVGVAIFPMEWECGTDCKLITLHGVCAVLFFICIAYVCLFRASDTLDLVKDQIKEKRYRKIYKGLGIGMLLSPAIAVIMSLVLQYRAAERSTVFFVEAVAVWIFAIYWLTKSQELSSTDAEQLALDRKIETTPSVTSNPLATAHVEQLA
jgi:hypothetical protein